MYRINVYIPESHLEPVKQAMFAAGAGRIGHYDSCCWQSQGQGQFRPLEGSLAFIGTKGQIECVAEYKVEMVCSSSLIRQVIKSMIKAHPYEEPAYDIYKGLTLDDI